MPEIQSPYPENKSLAAVHRSWGVPTDEELLLRFMPKVCYDSLEAYFADDPLQMLVNPGNTLRRGPTGGRDGELLSTAPNIELDWPKYPDGKAGAESDRLGIKGRDYRTQYVALRMARPDLADFPTFPTRHIYDCRHSMAITGGASSNVVQ